MKYTDLGFTTASVVGIGISNIPLIGWLTERGVKVTARDVKPREQLEPAATRLEENGVRIICGEAYLDGITDEAIFRAPGIRYDKPQFRTAVERGAKLTSEMELFFELCPATIIGVTGSDGKTTTTTIISKLIEAQYGKVYVGGNIGGPLLPRIEEMTENDWAVVELSSFQLHTMRRSPHIAVITNISPNHLDYHIDMLEYIGAKRNIFRHQRPGDRVVLNYKNDITRDLGRDIGDGAQLTYFQNENGVFERDGVICYHDAKRGDVEVLRESDILLPGHHNIENYMAAIGAVWGIVDIERITELARTFGGVEHRLELIREKDGVRYYNSSIDSSPTRTIAALSAFAPRQPQERNIIVLCGGYDKHIPFEPLGEPLCRAAKAVVLTGATAPKIKIALTKCDAYKSIPPKLYEDAVFDRAVKKACSLALPGDIVLLSPACASFGAFKNFEERGRHFKDLINAL
ncbi:MAG: UDP-N-acetylmuramoyl-L-alanine--D-glutamate ligase [Eubacteriales bacterium]